MSLSSVDQCWCSGAKVRNLCSRVNLSYLAKRDTKPQRIERCADGLLRVALDYMDTFKPDFEHLDAKESVNMAFALDTVVKPDDASQEGFFREMFDPAQRTLLSQFRDLKTLSLERFPIFGRFLTRDAIKSIVRGRDHTMPTSQFECPESLHGIVIQVD